MLDGKLESTIGFAGKSEYVSGPVSSLNGFVSAVASLASPPASKLLVPGEPHCAASAAETDKTKKDRFMQRS